MSTLVDERIVSMGFDNKDFERNVKQSMSTLDRLKAKLSFSGVANSMNDSLNAVDSSGLVSHLDKAKEGFTAMEIVAISILNNITNKVVDMGLQLAKSLTLDNITDGWIKYGQKTQSIATLMAQGLKDEDGTLLDDVAKLAEINKQLDLLTFYADETSYSFSDMLKNITKFTGAGVSLEDATQAMIGSSNWAALSGQDAATAARVQLQLSQAMGVGAMTLIDWKSIQNANMATEEFKQNAIDAAVAQGTLTQSINGTYQTLDGTEVSTSNFRNTLSSRWFTSDILLSVLKEYGGAAQEIYDIVSNNDDITNSAQAYAMLGDSVGEFAIKAYKAAQESKTLQQALDATKESVGTAWTHIFTAIFGNLEEAKALWTELVNSLYYLFVDRLADKVFMFQTWKDLGGRDDLFQREEGNNGAFWNLLDALQQLRDLVSDAWAKVFFEGFETRGEVIAESARRMKDFTAGLKTFTEGFLLNEKATKTFTNIFAGMFSILKAFGKLVGAIWRGISPLLGLVGEMASVIANMLGGTGNGLTEFVNQTLLFEYIGDVLFAVSTKIANALRAIGYWFGDVYSKMAANEQIQNGMSAVIEFFKTLPSYIITFVNAVKGSTVSGIFGSLVDAMQSFYTGISNAFSKIGNLDTGKLDVLGEETMQKLSPLTELFKGIGSILVGVFSVVNSILPLIGQAFAYLGQILQYIGDKISTVFDGSDGIGIEKLMDIAFWTTALFLFTEILDGIYIFTTSLSEMLAGIGGSLEGLEFKMKSEAIRNLGISLLLIAAAIFIIAAIPEEGFYRAVAVIGALGIVMVFLTAGLKRFSPMMSRISISSLFMAAQMKIASMAMVDFGKAMLLFVASVWILSTIPADKLVTGLVGLIAIATTMVIFAKLINKNSKGMFLAGPALIAMALAMSMMAVSLKILGTMDKDAMDRGLGAMAGIMAIMLTFSLMSKYVRRANRTAFGMVIFAGALTAAIVPLMILSRLSWDQLRIGLAGIAGIAGVMMVMAQASRFVSKAIITSVGIAALSIGLSMFGGSLAILSALKWDGIYKALAAIGLLVGLVILVTATSGTALLSMVGLGISLVVLSVGLLAYAFAMKKLGQNDWGSMGKALIMLGIMIGLMVVLTNQFGAVGIIILAALGVSLVTLSIGLYAFAVAMKKLGSISWGELGMAFVVLISLLPLAAILGAVLGLLTPLLIPFGIAIGTVGIGLMLFGVGMKVLGTVKWGTLAKGIALLVVSLIIMGVAATYLAPLIPVIIGLGLAFVAFGLGIALVGIGLFALTIVMSTFGAVAAKVFIGFLDLLIGLVPKIGQALVALTTVVVNALITLVPKLMNLLEVVLVKVINFLEAYGPQIIAVAVMLVVLLVTALADNFEPIAEAIVTMIIKLLKVVEENIEPIVDVIIGVIDKLLIAIGEKIPEILTMLIDTAALLIDGLIDALGGLIEKIVAAAADLIITFIDSLGVAIEENAGPIGDAMAGFMEHMWNAMLAFWGIASPSKKMIELAGYLIDGVVKGFTDKWYKVLNIVTEKFDLVVTKLSKLPGEFVDIGKDIVNGLIDGLEAIDLGAVMDDVFGWLPKWVKDALGIKSPSTVFAELGGFVIAGFKEGLESIDLGAVMDDVFGWLPKWIKDKLGIKSPSKVFADLGGYVSEGMAVGISGNSNMVKDEAELMAQGAVDGVEGSGIAGLMAKVYAMLNGEFEDGIVIRPVMDLTGIYEGRDQIYSMMKDLNGINVDGSNDIASRASDGLDSKKTSAISTNKNTNQEAQSGQTTISNTFHISGGNAKSIAKEVAKTLQNQVDRRQAQWAR